MLRERDKVTTDPKERVIAAIELLLDEMTIEDVEGLAANFEHVVSPPLRSPSRKNKAAALINATHFSKDDLFKLEAEQLRLKFTKRRELLEGALSTAEVAELLRVSRQTPHDRVKSNSLLAIAEKGSFLFPKWQFDEKGPNGVIKGLAEVLVALTGLSPLEKISWFVKPNPYLKNLTPLAALKKNRVEKVAKLAKNVGNN